MKRQGKFGSSNYKLLSREKPCCRCSYDTCICIDKDDIKDKQQNTTCAKT